jgi:hypothetical protein
MIEHQVENTKNKKLPNPIQVTLLNGTKYVCHFEGEYEDIFNIEQEKARKLGKKLKLNVDAVRGIVEFVAYNDQNDASNANLISNAALGSSLSQSMDSNASIPSFLDEDPINSNLTSDSFDVPILNIEISGSNLSSNTSNHSLPNAESMITGYGALNLTLLDGTIVPIVQQGDFMKAFAAEQRKLNDDFLLVVETEVGRIPYGTSSSEFHPSFTEWSQIGQRATKKDEIGFPSETKEYREESGIITRTSICR